VHRLTLPLAALALTPFVLAQDGMSPDAPPPMPPVEDAPEPGPAPYEADEAYETISTELSLHRGATR
jgi:hypothetical protein